MELFVCQVKPEEAGQRIDRYLAEQLEGASSRSAVQKLCENGNVCIETQCLSKNYKVRAGDTITVTISEPVELDVEPENIPLEIVYEDDFLLVVNKPKGMVVHPAPGNYTGTLVNALLYHCRQELSGINGVIRPGIVHRIDKDTSGLLIVAKTDAAHLGLAQQIKEHSFKRQYQAIAYGGFAQESGTIDAPVGRHKSDRKKMCVTTQNSRNAVTHYTVLESLGPFSYLQLQLETGRTHQIRVHLAYIGHPVAGDPVYGPKNVIGELHGQCLHAKVIGFTHPITGAYLEFDSPLPAYFENFLQKCRKRVSGMV